MTQALMKVEPAGLPAIPSVLGNRRFALQTGGTIRPGIKVLTRAAEKLEGARQIYEEGVAAGLCFDDIEQRIKQALPQLANPLTPRNVPYFTVRRGDFAMPEIAAQIMDQYAEDRGDGVKRLYRFPVVFASDNLLDVMPHKLAAYGSGSIKFWSEFSEDGNERYCMTHAPVPKTSSGKAVRLFGGRKHQRRDDNHGKCDPEACPQYQARQCNVSGRLIFYVPGITSVVPFELPTNSLYGLDSVRRTLQKIAEMRHGRFSGFLQGREAFWLTKKLEEVPHIDEEGKAVRVTQWIIGLEVMIDPTRLLAPPDERAAVADAERAVQVLQGTAEPVVEPSAMQPPRRDDREARATGVWQPKGAPQRANGDDREHGEDRDFAAEYMAPATGSQSANAGAAAKPNGAGNKPPAQTASRTTPGSTTSSAGLEEVTHTASAVGVDPEAFVKYAAKRWGLGWCKNPNGLRRAIEELEAFRGNAPALVEKMNAELVVFS